MLAEMLNGVPENAVKYELTCQPDRILLAAPPLLANFRPGPNGSSYYVENDTFVWCLPPYPLIEVPVSGIRRPPAHTGAFGTLYDEGHREAVVRRRLWLTCSESYLTLPSGGTMLISGRVRKPPRDAGGWNAAPVFRRRLAEGDVCCAPYVWRPDVSDLGEICEALRGTLNVR